MIGPVSSVRLLVKRRLCLARVSEGCVCTGCHSHKAREREKRERETKRQKKKVSDGDHTQCLCTRHAAAVLLRWGDPSVPQVEFEESVCTLLAANSFFFLLSLFFLFLSVFSFLFAAMLPNPYLMACKWMLNSWGQIKKRANVQQRGEGRQ